ncbi:hypothetical protein HY546_02505, partial [archaeon]|nr:hypothetical protein [archaeon]
EVHQLSSHSFNALLITSAGNAEKIFTVRVFPLSSKPPPDAPLAIVAAIIILIVGGALFLYPFFHARKKPFETERGREHLIVQKGKKKGHN